MIVSVILYLETNKLKLITIYVSKRTINNKNTNYIVELTTIAKFSKLKLVLF